MLLSCKQSHGFLLISSTDSHLLVVHPWIHVSYVIHGLRMLAIINCCKDTFEIEHLDHVLMPHLSKANPAVMSSSGSMLSDEFLTDITNSLDLPVINADQPCKCVKLANADLLLLESCLAGYSSDEEHDHVHISYSSLVRFTNDKVVRNQGVHTFGSSRGVDTPSC